MTPGAWVLALLREADARVPRFPGEHCALIADVGPSPDAADELTLVLPLPSGYQRLAILPADYERTPEDLVSEALRVLGG